MKQQSTINHYNVVSKILLTLLVVLPISIPIVVLLSQNFSIFLVSAWKEVILLAATPFAMRIIINDRYIGSLVIQQRIVQLILIFLCFYTTLGILTWRGIGSAASFATGTGYLYAFLIALIFGLKYSRLWMIAIKTVCLTAVIVSIFGIIQALFLPIDLLASVGYDVPGINKLGVPPAYHLIADNDRYIRAQSSLRGPNVLGAYLILPTIISIYYFKKGQRKIYGFALIICFSALFLSYSRSAWIGSFIGLLIYLFLSLKKGQRNSYLDRTKISFALLLSVATLVFIGMRDNSFMHTIIFHSEPGKVSVSNMGHKDAVIKGVGDILQEPFGGGVGTAGPASVISNSPRISENYFIQVGQEIGLIGLVLFCLICIELARFCYLNRDNDASKILFSSFMGLTITALFLHTWSDESVAITWWIVGGLGLSVILENNLKHEKIPVKEKRSQRS